MDQNKCVKCTLSAVFFVSGRFSDQYGDRDIRSVSGKLQIIRNSWHRWIFLVTGTSCHQYRLIEALDQSPLLYKG